MTTSATPIGWMTTCAAAALLCLAAPAVATPDAKAKGDPTRGARLVEQFQCNRCHEGLATKPIDVSRHCVRCHQQVRDGTIDAPPAAIKEWRSRLVHLLQTPSLTASKRFRAAWLADFLQHPQDLRPRLAATMPRLNINARQARDIAAWLGTAEPPRVDLRDADPARGRQLFADNGCASCHAFSGARVGPPPPGARRTPEAQTQIRALAPDLKHTRRRLGSATLVQWLRSPKSVKKDAAMPDFGLSKRDAHDLARFILSTPLQRPVARRIPRRLPPLQRRVHFEEVATKVLRQTCWHCHAEPQETGDDGGPGYGGGFGFPGRAISLVDHAGVMAGAVLPDGKRQSLIQRDRKGVPRLVQVLMARHAEVAGRPIPGVRGMPLGLPPLTLQQIRLVETWIRQGARP